MQYLVYIDEIADDPFHACEIIKKTPINNICIDNLLSGNIIKLDSKSVRDIAKHFKAQAISVDLIKCDLTFGDIDRVIWLLSEFGCRNVLLSKYDGFSLKRLDQFNVYFDVAKYSLVELAKLVKLPNVYLYYSGGIGHYKSIFVLFKSKIHYVDLIDKLNDQCVLFGSGCFGSRSLAFDIVQNKLDLKLVCRSVGGLPFLSVFEHIGSYFKECSNGRFERGLSENKKSGQWSRQSSSDAR